MSWRKGLVFVLIIFVIYPVFAFADSQGQRVNFFVDSQFDILSRNRVWASLIYSTPQLYFYIEDDFWNSQDSSQRQKILNSLSALASEFQEKIYPTLTATFGFEWRPGIDNDEHLTILFHRMKKEAGGYVNTGNEYSRLENPSSNEREMVYLNPTYLGTAIEKSYLAHEFMHLISWNQKERLFGAQEDIWLAEARSEVVVTLLGYDSVYESSNLQQRVGNFLSKPTDSLTEWKNTLTDYGVVNLFVQYLIDHYGIQVFSETLKMRDTGIASLNKFFKEKGLTEDFKDVFTNWTIAVLLNDCSLGEKYCYKNNHLENFQIVPSTNFLPFSVKSFLYVLKSTKNFSGNWEKFVGGKQNIRLEFDGADNANFRLPYVIQDAKGKHSLDFLSLDSSQKGVIPVADFGSENLSLTIMPIIMNKFSHFGSDEPSFEFSFKVSIVDGASAGEIEELKSQIEFLKQEIIRVQLKIEAILSQKKTNYACQRLEKDIFYGAKNNEVKCLQEFLKAQGQEIYPEGLVTGYFGFLTKKAVVRFQERYSQEILIPLGFEKGTGFVGELTRLKINEIIK